MAEKKFHIGQRGKARGRIVLCKAQNCDFGEHFESVEAGEKYQADQAKKEHGELESSRKKSSRRFNAGEKRAARYMKSWREAQKPVLKELRKNDPEAFKAREEALERRKSPGGTADGDWVPRNDDGSVPVDAGEYEVVFAEEWEEQTKSFEGADKWKAQAHADTEPGGIQGSYFKGKPVYLMTPFDRASEGSNPHSLVIVPKNLYEDLKNEGYEENQDKYGTFPMKVTKRVQAFGFHGSPHASDLVPTAYDYENGYLSNDSIWGKDEPLTGCVFVHPDVECDG